MRKQLNVLLFFVFCLGLLLASCTQTVKTNSLTIKVPSSGRSVELDYSLSDIISYQFTLSLDNEKPLEYSTEPGKDLIIDELETGTYELTAKALNADKRVIAYCSTKVTIAEGENTEVLKLKKTTLSNITAITHTRTKTAFEAYNNRVFSDLPEYNRILEDVDLTIKYASGFEEKMNLEDFLTSGFYVVELRFLTNQNDEFTNSAIDPTVNKAKLVLIKPGCTPQEWFAATQTEQQGFIGHGQELFEYAYDVTVVGEKYPYKIYIYKQRTDLSYSSTPDETDENPDYREMAGVALSSHGYSTPDGFEEDPDNPVVYPVISDSAENIIKIYYRRRTYNIKYMVKNGTSFIDKTDIVSQNGENTSFKYGISVTLPDASLLDNENFIYDGWYATEACSGTKVTSTTTTEKNDITCYAIAYPKTGVSVVFGENDVQLTYNSTTQICTADTGYSSYKWLLDGFELSENSYQLSLGSIINELESGTEHTVTVIVVQETEPYSATITITIP